MEPPRARPVASPRPSKERGEPWCAESHHDFPLWTQRHVELLLQAVPKALPSSLWASNVLPFVLEPWGLDKPHCLDGFESQATDRVQVMKLSTRIVGLSHEGQEVDGPAPFLKVELRTVVLKRWVYYPLQTWEEGQGAAYGDWDSMHQKLSSHDLKQLENIALCVAGETYAGHCELGDAPSVVLPFRELPAPVELFFDYRWCGLEPFSVSHRFMLQQPRGFRKVPGCSRLKASTSCTIA